MEKELTARQRFDEIKVGAEAMASDDPMVLEAISDLKFLIRYAKAARETAAKWAREAQIESGEGIDPGLKMIRDVVDAEIEEFFKREEG